MGIGAALAGSSVIGSMISANGAQNAADTQAAAANNAANLQNQQWQQTQANLQPYMTGGTSALSSLSSMLGLGGSSGSSSSQPYTLNDFIGYDKRIAPSGYSVNGQLSDANDQFKLYQSGGYGTDQNAIAQRFGFAAPTSQTSQTDSNFGSLTKPFDASAFEQYQDPGYQFQLQQGQNALQNSQAAQSGVLSGAALKDLMSYNQGMANTAYQNAFDRWNTQNTNTYNRLSGLLGIGENAAVGAGNTGAQTTANIGNTMMSGASAQAAGQVGVANALTGSLNSGTGYYMMNNLTNGKLFGSGSTSSAAAGTAGGGVGTWVDG